MLVAEDEPLNREIIRILQLADVKQRLEGQGYELVWNTPAEFARLIEEETARWAKLARDIKAVGSHSLYVFNHFGILYYLTGEPLPVTVAVLVPPAVPPTTRFPAVSVGTAWLNVTANWTVKPALDAVAALAKASVEPARDAALRSERYDDYLRRIAAYVAHGATQQIDPATVRGILGERQ